MSTEHILAMRSEQGEIHLFDESDNFMADFKEGKWFCGTIFNFDDIWDNFEHISDDREVLRLLAEARAALDHTSTAG